MPPFFRYLNPPMISEVHKNNMCAYFLHNLLLSSFAKLIQTVMFNRYHDYRPKTYFTNITSQITMLWNRPCCSYQREICRQYAQICFRKSQKISGSQLKSFGRYLTKTRGVDKNNPPATNRVKGTFECILYIIAMYSCNNTTITLYEYQLSYVCTNNEVWRNVSIQHPCASAGLSMVLFLDTNNYMPSSVTQTVGARLAIHPSDVTPLMSEAGLEIGPASTNSISISDVRTGDLYDIPIQSDPCVKPRGAGVSSRTRGAGG